MPSLPSLTLARSYFPSGDVPIFYQLDTCRSGGLLADPTGPYELRTRDVPLGTPCSCVMT
jgi:hypothetical protein